MSAAELLSLFGGTAGGTAVAFCILFVSDMIYSRGAYNEMRTQRDEWKKAAELNAARAEAGVLAGQIAKDVMLGLHKELE